MFRTLANIIYYIAFLFYFCFFFFDGIHTISIITYVFGHFFDLFSPYFSLYFCDANNCLLSFSVFNTRGFLHTLLFGYSQSISVSLCLSFIVCCYFNNSFCLQFLSLFGHVDPIYYNYTFSLPISLSWGSLFIKSQFQFALFFFSIFHYIFSFLPLSLYSFHSLNSISLFSSYTHTHSVLTNCDA